MEPVIGISLMLLVTAPLWVPLVLAIRHATTGRSTGPLHDEGTRHALERLKESGEADALLGESWSVQPKGKIPDYKIEEGILEHVTWRTLPLAGAKGAALYEFQYRRTGQMIAFEGRLTAPGSRDVIIR